MINPLFSVIMANFNNSQYIDNAIKSLVVQTYTNWELIIVDDCSTDGSIESIKAIQNKYPDRKIKFSRNSINSGVGFTKGHCVNLSSGELVGILDPDDEIEANALEIMVDLHILHADAALIYSNCYICDADLNVCYPSTANRIPGGTTMLDCWNRPGFSLSHFTTFKRRYYNMTGGYDPYIRIAEDKDLYYKLEEVGRLLHTDDLLYKYRIHNLGLSTGKTAKFGVYWHAYIFMKACERRNYNFEKTIVPFMENQFQSPVKRSLEYKIGNVFIYPLRRLKKLVSQKVND